MWAIPHSYERVHSCWAAGMAPDVDRRVARVETAKLEGAVPTETDGEPLTDPPGAEVDGGGDTRASPPAIGAAQLGTTVEILKQAGVYRVVLDGVLMPISGDGRFWLPRFRDTADSEGVRAVGHLQIGLRLGEAEAPPLRAEVRVEQSVLDIGIPLQSGEVVHSEPLVPHDVGSVHAPTVTLPYPASITRPPYLTVVDTDARRRWEQRRRRWQRSRTIEIVGGIGELYRVLTGGGGDSGPGWFAAAKDVFGGTTPWRAAWKLLLPKVSPAIAQMVSTSSALLTVGYFGFESAQPPPTSLPTYDYSIPQLTAALQRISDTRADGTSAERPFGMSPDELTRQGHKSTAALLYWLLYGNSSTLAADTDAAVVQEDADEQGSLWTKLWPNLWPGALRWNTKTLTGNLINPLGLSARGAVETRVDHVVKVRISDEDAPGGKVEFTLSPLRANAVDAGHITAGLDEQLNELQRAVAAVAARLNSMQPYGLNWLHDRLFVANSQEGTVYGLNGLKRLWQATGSQSDAEARARWQALSKQEKGQSLEGYPIVFDAKAFKQRLGKLVHGWRVASNGGAKPAETDEVRWQRRKSQVVRKLPLLPGLTEQEFDAAVARLTEQHRREVGLTVEAYAGIERTHAFFRWVDTHAPALGAPDDERLSGFIVPMDGTTARRTPPPLVCTYAQLVNARDVPLLKTVAIPDDPLSERVAAKAAVAAARQAWRRIGGTRVSSSVHTSRCYDVKDGVDVGGLLAKLPRMRPCGSSLNVLALTGCQPTSVSVAERAAVGAIAADDAWAVKAATRSALSGDATLLVKLGLPTTRSALLAVHVFAAMLVHAAVSATALTERGSLGSSIVTRGRNTAAKVADLIGSLYGAESALRELLSANDLFFACQPGGEEVLCALLHMDRWRNAQRRVSQRDASSPPLDLATDWPVDARQEVSDFVRSLRRLARSKQATPHLLPVVALHSMWCVGNPTIERLQALHAQSSGKTGVEMQIAEAVASFRRVRLMLGDTDAASTPASMAALTSVIASRPILLPVDSEDIVHALGGGMVAAKALLTPTATRFVAPLSFVAIQQLRVRSAGLRLDRAFSTRHEDATKTVGVLQLIDHMSVLAVGEVARYMVPPGSPLDSVRSANVTPGDLSYSRLEDSVMLPDVMLATLATARPAAKGQPPAAVQVAVVGHRDANSRVRHPHLLEVVVDSKGTETWTAHFAKMPPLVDELRDSLSVAAASLPTSVFSVLKTLSDATGRARSPSWLLIERTRALMFGIDRAAQLCYLLEAVGASQPQAATVHVSSKWSAPQTAALAVMLALGSAFARTQMGATPRVSLSVLAASPGVEIGIQSALALVESAVARMEGAMPLSEVCLSLAALLE